ncbi:MAG: hypothetical protein CBE41_01615 [Gammaproteobacteria bacterium TMED281]|nr:MAG: hypothetical protein CBE41_01615 [Gammaproteobacteria bacterium TMED281]
MKLRLSLVLLAFIAFPPVASTSVFLDPKFSAGSLMTSSEFQRTTGAKKISAVYIGIDKKHVSNRSKQYIMNSGSQFERNFKISWKTLETNHTTDTISRRNLIIILKKKNIIYLQKINLMLPFNVNFVNETTRYNKERKSL